MEDQMRVTYAKAAKILARFGATLDHVVEETLYVLDVDAAFAVAGKVRKEAYSTDRPQCASNLIGVTRLAFPAQIIEIRSEEHTSELQSLMRISYAVFCLKKKKNLLQCCISHLILQTSDK